MSAGEFSATEISGEARSALAFNLTQTLFVTSLLEDPDSGPFPCVFPYFYHIH